MNLHLTFRLASWILKVSLALIFLYDTSRSDIAPFVLTLLIIFAADGFAIFLELTLKAPNPTERASNKPDIKEYPFLKKAQELSWSGGSHLDFPDKTSPLLPSSHHTLRVEDGHLVEVVEGKRYTKITAVPLAMDNEKEKSTRVARNRLLELREKAIRLTSEKGIDILHARIAEASAAANAAQEDLERAFDDFQLATKVFCEEMRQKREQAEIMKAFNDPTKATSVYLPSMTANQVTSISDSGIPEVQQEPKDWPDDLPLIDLGIEKKP